MKIQLGEISFQVDESYLPEFWNHVNAGKWEQDTFDVLNHFVSSGSCVVDLGCWIGPISLYSAQKGGRVYAVDPDPEAFKWLLKNVQLNPELQGQIYPKNTAISDESGTQALYARSGYGNSSSSILKRTRDRVSSATIPKIRLDEFLATNGIDHVDFLKIDIEGGEFAIMEQLEALKTENKCHHIFLAIHYDHLNEAIYQKKIGWRFLSLSLMKLERITGWYLFRKELLRSIQPICSLAEKFNYVYSPAGHRIPSNEMTPQYLLKRKPDLLLSDTEWKKSL